MIQKRLKRPPFLVALIFMIGILASVNTSAQTPTPSPKIKGVEMAMPTPAPTPKKADDSFEKPRNMEMPSPTPTPTPADDSSHKSHNMDSEMKEAKPELDTAPEENISIELPEPGLDFPEPIEDSANYGLVLVELLEYDAATKGQKFLNWDMIGWYGGDYNRFWFRSEGEISQSKRSNGKVELQGLYGRMIAPYYDFQVGIRYDRKWNGSESISRFHAVAGLTGLVPYEYEVEPLMFVSDKGDVSFRFTGVKDILITQKTVFEGRFETNVAVQKVESFGVGSGLNDMKFGVRIRRELRREFAPYIGLTYKRLFGQTADFARLEGERADRLSFVAGVRMWF